MFKLVIQDDEGKTTVVPLIRDEITIGRKEGNTIRLTERNVSRRHARILRNNGEVHIEDLGSYNGIRVNNARIAERVSLRVSDQVQIGDYKLYLKAEGLDQVDESRTTPIERVESAGASEPMPIVAGTPTPVPALPTLPPMIGNPNRTLVAIADTDPGRAVGPVTQAAVAALTAPGGYGKLVVLSSNFAGKEFELSRPQMIIGRTDENDIVINHRSISRNHAKLSREPETGRYTISDLQSSNGVRVNGSDYGKVELRRGDVVDLGHVRLRFVEAGEDFVFARDAVITDVPEAGGRRGMLFAVIAVILVIAAGVTVYVMRQRHDDSSASPAPGSGPSGSVPADAGDSAVATAPNAATGPATPETSPGGSAQGAVPAVATDNNAATVQRPGKPEDDKTQQDKTQQEKTQIVKCTEAVVQKDWTALNDCATALRGLGATAKADDFAAKAKQELQNSIFDTDARAALRGGKLKEATGILQKIGSTSVYFKSLSDVVTKAENAQVDDARHRAQSLANVHDWQQRHRARGGGRRRGQVRREGRGGEPTAGQPAQAAHRQRRRRRLRRLGAGQAGRQLDVRHDEHRRCHDAGAEPVPVGVRAVRAQADHQGAGVQAGPPHAPRRGAVCLRRP
ncbi:MAG: FHA domain-containing protein [Deltaproteobacteria bacterium]|nr:MAG: FHA domain-containing protein [Deltaproteobacteria bacterium]